MDEAYAEYGKYSLIAETTNSENLLILRTFSKAYTVVDLQLGSAFTTSELVTTINERYMIPYTVSTLVLQTVIEELNQLCIECKVKQVKTDRKQLIKQLNKILGVKAFSSNTNFVLFQAPRPINQVHSSFMKKGIVISKISRAPGYSKCLLVTVAPEQIKQMFIESLEEV